MRRLSPPLLLLVAISCQPRSENKPFAKLGQPPPTVDPSGTSGANAATAVAAVASASSSSTGVPVVADCHCIHEIFHVTACSDCEVQSRAGACLATYDACLADADCQVFLQQFCPMLTQKDDPSAIAQCLNAGAAAQPLLQSYFECICSNPGPCAIDCHASLECGQGGAGGQGGAATSSTTGATSASTSSTSTGM